MATCMRLILILLLYMLVDHEDYPHLAALCFMLPACLNEVLPHACTNGNITHTFWHMFSRNSQPASVLSIAMDQFTCTVLLDVATCFRAWGYWMHETHWEKKARVCNAADATDDEGDEMHCKKKARVCNAADSTDEGSDDASRLKMRVGGG